MLNLHGFRKQYFYAGTAANTLLAIIFIFLLQLSYNGGFQEIKIKLYLTVFLAVVILHQLFLIAILPRIKSLGNFYKNSAVAIGSTILVLLAAEVFLQTTQASQLSSYAQCDSIVHHSRIPNGFGTYVDFAHEYTINYSINSLGFRDKEYNKTCDCYRILMMGDSITEGKGVEEEYTFQNLVEEKLNSVYSNIEVINTGIDSNSPVLEYLQLKNKLLELEPDLIILNFDIGDVYQDSGYLRTATFEDEELIAINGCKEREQARSNIKLYVLLNNIIDQSVVKFNIKINIVSNPLTPEWTYVEEAYLNSEVNNDTWDITLFYLDKIINLTKDVDFILTTYPRPYQVSATEMSEGRKMMRLEPGRTYSLDPQKRIKKFCEQRNLSCLDITPAFIKSNTTNSYKYDLHWNENGNKVAADAIFNFLINNQLIENINNGGDAGKS